ncbi:MAG: GNAT family N-acetyltransferase, partial [Anaerolineae bacterium]|nr:GNAT family N-acetyltransferase [Anaerolineae bacterium]
GVVDTNASHLRREWEVPGFDLAADARLVYSADGMLVGYVEAWLGEPYVHPHIWGCVHPDYQGQGIGAALMDWAEARAADALQLADPAHRVSIKAGADHRNERTARLYTRRGYVPVRHYWHMVRNLDPDETPEVALWPDGVTVRPYIPRLDDRFVYRAVQDAFRDHWGFTPQPYDEWITFMTSGEDFDPSLWVLAVSTESDGNDIVGVSLCRPGRPQDPDMGWINVLAVDRAWRRQGLARALLQYTFAEFHRRGKPRVGLSVDAANLTGATRLYESAGMRVFRQWDQYEKVLRDGVEVSTQQIEE